MLTDKWSELLEVMTMLNPKRNAYGQMQDLMSQLALAGLVVTGLVITLVALLGAG